MGSNNRSTIHLLGDAILDNYYWLTDKDRDLRKEIVALGYSVNNYAVDDITVSNLIGGIAPKEVYQKSRSYAYPIEKDGKMYPLQLLARNIGINRTFSSTYGAIKPIGSSITEPDKDHMVVLSMGGSDLGANVLKIFLGMDNFINSVITEQFIASYDQIISNIKRSCDKIVLISIYLPYMGPGSMYNLYSAYAKPVMDKWHNFLYTLAKKHNIAVLDLNRTFNSADRSHYGSDVTRASNKSSKCMAQCLAYIQANYKGYKIYYAPNCDASKIIAE